MGNGASVDLTSKEWTIAFCSICAASWLPCVGFTIYTCKKCFKLYNVKGEYEKKEKDKENLVRDNWAVYFRNLEQSRIQSWAYEPLKEMADERRGALDFLKLKREAARMISVDAKIGRGASEIERVVIIDYVRAICDEKEEKNAERAGLVRTVVGCRNEKIKIRRDTQTFLFSDDDKFPIDCLHMTVMHDYYGYKVYLSQAPVPQQFEAHWRAIWQEDIGVIVMIGALVELNRRKMDAYIAMIEKGEMICGAFKILTTSIIKATKQHDTYSISVTLGKETRELFLIHVHSWPDHKQPDDPQCLVDLLVQVQGRQIIKERENSLTGLLVHCSIGVQRSPAFVAAYLGRQMWMATRTTNPLAIFRYIRQHRWRAFTMGNPFSQVQIVFGILQVVAARTAKDEVVGKPQMTAEERAVFDRKLRLAEVSLEAEGKKPDSSSSKENDKVKRTSKTDSGKKK